MGGIGVDLRADRTQAGVEDGEEVVELGGGDGEGRGGEEVVAAITVGGAGAGVGDEAAGEGGGGDAFGDGPLWREGLFLRPVADELETGEEAEAAEVADDRV